jgi:endonuclease-3
MPASRSRPRRKRAVAKPSRGARSGARKARVLRGEALAAHALEIQRRLLAAYPAAECELHHANALQLAVATILSAQCTDKRVNLVTPAVFARYPDAASLAAAEPAELEEIIRSTGFYRNKTRNIIGMAKAIVERHGGQVPRTMPELVGLPGIGRKTANVVLGNAFDIPGIVVDTHCGRVSQRLGLTTAKDPVKIEFDLMDLVPQERWTRFSLQLIWHGRAICTARSPQCPGCPLLPFCDYGQKAMGQ